MPNISLRRARLLGAQVIALVISGVAAAGSDAAAPPPPLRALDFGPFEAALGDLDADRLVVLDTIVPGAIGSTGLASYV